MKIYKGRITKLEPHQYFVFGSNTEGRHGKGAALYARIHFGAVYGNPKGFQGKSYAIITKDLGSNFHPSISRKKITGQISELYDIAQNYPRNQFFIAYTNSPMLNGYTAEQMAEMFTHDLPPDNIFFEESFAKLMKKYL